MVENKYNRAFLHLTETCIHNVSSWFQLSWCKTGAWFKQERFCFSEKASNKTPGQEHQCLKMRGFCEVRLCGWIYTKYSEACAQCLKAMAWDHLYYLIACTDSGMGLTPASGYSHKLKAVPHGQFGCSFPGFGARTQTVLHEEALGTEVALGSLCVQVWGWLCATLKLGSIFTCVTWHPFEAGSCMSLYKSCILVCFLKIHCLLFLVGADFPLICLVLIIPL